MPERKPWFAGKFNYPNAEIVDVGARPILTVSDNRTAPEEFRKHIKSIVHEHNSYDVLVAEIERLKKVKARMEATK